ncbi:unnamed protein product [Gongylonema pulchrum]|uniref:Leishmanolysin-like peptidase n=1 Tax=Gongylonema pulchrum TaxID=637853 RepID=A0A183CX10_9BILA|nr:unnamed protein product [Gongylonema pulchrum]
MYEKTSRCTSVLEGKISCDSEKFTRETMPGAQYYDGKKLNIPISTEAGMELHERWAHQGISSVMSAIAKQSVENLNEFERSRLYRCSRSAEDIYEHAKCVIRVIDIEPRQKHMEKR